MKNISQEQIEAVLNTVFETNISAKQFVALQKFFEELPVVEESKEVDKTIEPKK